MTEITIIGGGGAGLTAAIAAKKTARDANVTLITRESRSYSPCALPFVLDGEIPSASDIISSIEEICAGSNIRCLIDTAVSIDLEKKIVATEKNGAIAYDSLVIATGAHVFVPPVKGACLGNVFTLYTLEDCDRIKTAAKNAKNAVVVGGGAIGLEAAASLTKLGVKATLVEFLPRVLQRSLDLEFSGAVEDKMREKGVELILGKAVEEISGEKNVKSVKVDGKDLPADIVIMAAGVRASSKMAEDAGIKTDRMGIETDKSMRTSAPDVYAAGDCCVSTSSLTGKKMPIQLGTVAVRHGLVAGANAAGGNATLENVLASMALRIFDLEIGRTGLTEEDAKAEGIKTVTSKVKSTTYAQYYPGAKEVEVKLIFDAGKGTLIGAQVSGYGGVTGKIDLLSLAISKKATAEDLSDLDYCYTPPLAPSHSAVVSAAETAVKKIRRLEEMERRKKA